MSGRLCKVKAVWQALRAIVILQGVLWLLSHACWNKLMHALHGNTASSSGGPDLLPAWMHRPVGGGGQTVEGRVTGHWRAAHTPPLPVFDIWAMHLPGEVLQAMQQAPVPTVAVAPPAFGGAPDGANMPSSDRV